MDSSGAVCVDHKNSDNQLAKNFRAGENKVTQSRHSLLSRLQQWMAAPETGLSIHSSTHSVPHSGGVPQWVRLKSLSVLIEFCILNLLWECQFVLFFCVCSVGLWCVAILDAHSGLPLSVAVYLFIYKPSRYGARDDTMTCKRWRSERDWRVLKQVYCKRGTVLIVCKYI